MGNVAGGGDKMSSSNTGQSIVLHARIPYTCNDSEDHRTYNHCAPHPTANQHRPERQGQATRLQNTGQRRKQ
eukprot:m.263031 g.263031  ORF g.263031 m.263031 type:complete len:72 (-) comp15597_c0_seq10:2072-2287(-)